MNLSDLRTSRGFATAVCVAILATVVAAFAIPPGVSGGDTPSGASGGFGGDLLAVAPEDLGGFVRSERWGVSFEEVMETAERSGRGLNPALEEMGFLGFMETVDGIWVLLADPEPDGGGIIELAPGDALPDGRVLTSVTDNSITLTRRTESGDAAEGDQEVLLLFPRGESDLDPAEGA